MPVFILLLAISNAIMVTNTAGRTWIQIQILQATRQSRDVTRICIYIRGPVAVIWQPLECGQAIPY